MRITDLARVLAPDAKVQVTGIRPGEKLHEMLVSEDEARNTLEFEDMYVVEPLFPWWTNSHWTGGTRLPDGFQYSGDNNSQWLTDAQLLEMIGGTA